MGRIIYSHNYKKKPVWFRLINKAWKASYPFGTGIRLSKDSLIRAARKNTGLVDFGVDFWDEPLDRMLRSINEEARLHPIGRFITRQRLVNLLSIRLRAEYWFRKHPEILERPLYPVLMIIGLQRTGTTKLQRMLASDPHIRSLLSWEAINPVPLNDDIHEKKLRIRQAKLSEKALKIMAPDFFAIHPVEHMEPEEDILLLDVSFMSTTTEATMHVPSYSSWLETIDQSLAYAYAARLLKFLQYQRPARRWVLKSPHHLEFLDLVKQYFGDVHFLWTHRNVQKSIPSFISMMAHSRSIFSDHTDPAVIRDHWLKKNKYMLDKAMKYRLGHENNVSFTDIFYDQLISHPMTILEKIYSLQDEMDEMQKQRVWDLSKKDIREKYGYHVYDRSDFEITREQIENHTKAYREFIKSKQEQGIELVK